MAGVSPRILVAAAVSTALAALAGPAWGWSSYRLGSYTLDVSLEGEQKASARLTLEVEILGGRFRGFKIARGDEGLAWSASSMYCENTSGKRYVLRRVQRADGLTDFKFMTPGFIPRGSATCSLEYGFNPVELGSIQLVSGQDPSREDGGERVRFTFKSPGLPVAVEQFVITLHLPSEVDAKQRELGDFTSEEYTVEHFPSAMTFRRYRPPPYYTGLVDVILPQHVLIDEAQDGDQDGAVGRHHVERFVGIAAGEGLAGADTLWMFSVLALLALLMISAKHLGTRSADRLAGVTHPYLLFRSSSSAIRLAATAGALALYVVLAAGGRDAAALMTLAGALLMNLRSGLVVDQPGGGATRWVETDLASARRHLRAAGRRESSARLFLDATTAPGLALALAAAAGLLALMHVVLVDHPATAVRLVAAGAVVLSFIFLTSTRLGGWGHLAARTLRKLVAVRREYEILGEDPPPVCLGHVHGSTIPELRLRCPVATPGSHEDAVIEVGVEWSRGWCHWRGCFAAMVRLDARSGAIVAGMSCLEKAEVHTRVEEGRTAIIVRSLDPRLSLFLARAVQESLAGGARCVSGADAFLSLHVGQPRPVDPAHGRDAAP